MNLSPLSILLPLLLDKYSREDAEHAISVLNYHIDEIKNKSPHSNELLDSMWYTLVISRGNGNTSKLGILREFFINKKFNIELKFRNDDIKLSVTLDSLLIVVMNAKEYHNIK